MDSTVLSSSPDRQGTLRCYFELTKPPIVLLLVFACVTAMFVAARGIPDWLTLIVTVIGGSLSAAGASAINQFIDREMDAKMRRTAHRPLPSGRIQPINALIFGFALIAWAIFLLAVFVNWLAAGLALLGVIYYVVVYTMILKRNTVVNIVIGGGAGAMPVLVGWAAVTNALSVEAFILFAIIFYWTPPHSWALALLVNQDYAAANIPMMPVARGKAITHRQILFYSIQLVLITLLPGLTLFLPDSRMMLGVIYLAAALILGAGMIWFAIVLIRMSDRAAARRLWKYSSRYLALLFLAMIIDRMVLA